MKRSRFTDSQILAVLKQAEAVTAVSDLRGKRWVTTYIQPGKSQQSAYVERFNRTVRYKWLAQYCLDVISEAQDFATRWIWNYNHDRSNMALDGVTPKQRLAMAA